MRSRPWRAVVFLKLAGVLQSWADALRRRTGRNLPGDGGAAPARAPSTPGENALTNQVPRPPNSGPPEHWLELLKNAQGWIDMPAPGSGRTQPAPPPSRERHTQPPSEPKRPAERGEETARGAGIAPSERADHKKKTVSEEAQPDLPGAKTERPTLHFPTLAAPKKPGQPARVEIPASPRYPAAQQATPDASESQPAGQVEPEEKSPTAVYQVRFPSKQPGSAEFSAPRRSTNQNPVPPPALPTIPEFPGRTAFEAGSSKPPVEPRLKEPALWPEMEGQAARDGRIMDEISQPARPRSPFRMPEIVEPAPLQLSRFPKERSTVGMETRSAAALFPGLSSPPQARQASPQERENTWPELDAKPYDQVSDTFNDVLRERMHLQKLEREQRGELWNE